MAIGAKHLRNGVFHDHAFIDVHFVEEDGLVQGVVGEGPVHESLGDEQACVGHIAFLFGMVGAQCEPDAGVGGVEAGVDDHRLVQPDKGVFEVLKACVFVQGGKVVAFFFF